MRMFIKATMAAILLGLTSFALPAAAETTAQRTFTIRVSGEKLNVVYQFEKTGTGNIERYTATWDALPSITVNGSSFRALVDDLLVKARIKGKVFEWSSIQNPMTLSGMVTSIREGNLRAPDQPPGLWVALAGQDGDETFILEALFPNLKMLKPGDEPELQAMPFQHNNSMFAVSFRNLTRDITTQ